MKTFLAWLWTNRTRTFAFLQGLVAIFAGMTDVFDGESIKWLLAGNAVLTYALGQFNAWQSQNSPPKPDVTGG